jgi:hemerythrin
MKMTQEYRCNPSDALIAQIISVVGQWVTNHIKNEDKIMAQYVLSRIDEAEKRARR